MQIKGDIRIICFLPNNGDAGEGLRRAVMRVFPPEQIDCCRSLDEFSRRLRAPWAEPPILAIMAESREKLFDILMYREMLYDRRIILLLPDDDPETFALGHSLRPRFIAAPSDDLGNVSAVLERMIGRC